METVVTIIVAGLLAIVGIIAAAVLMPLGYAADGYLTGWVLKVIFPFAGQWIVSGANHLGVEIALETLLVTGAALGFAGSFFKATQSNKNECQE